MVEIDLYMYWHEIVHYTWVNDKCQHTQRHFVLISCKYKYIGKTLKGYIENLCGGESRWRCKNKVL